MNLDDGILQERSWPSRNLGRIVIVALAAVAIVLVIVLAMPRYVRPRNYSKVIGDYYSFEAFPTWEIPYRNPRPGLALKRGGSFETIAFPVMSHFEGNGSIVVFFAFKEGPLQEGLYALRPGGSPHLLVAAREDAWFASNSSGVQLTERSSGERHLWSWNDIDAMLR